MKITIEVDAEGKFCMKGSDECVLYDDPNEYCRLFKQGLDYEGQENRRTGDYEYRPLRCKQCLSAFGKGEK